MRLIESNATRRRHPAGVVASMVLHVGVVALAVAATASAATHDEPPTPERVAIWVAPTPEPAPATARRTSAEGGAAASTTTPSVPVVAMPLVDVSFDLPTGTSPVLADPAAGAAASFADRPALGRGDGTGVGSGGGGRALEAHAVDRAVIPLGSVRPRYPEMLRAAGISGRVLARFVVDTLGRVEESGVEIGASSHPAFADAVRRTLPALRFRPAEAAGRRVRQLVEMPFEFVVR